MAIFFPHNIISGTYGAFVTSQNGGDKAYMIYNNKGVLYMRNPEFPKKRKGGGGGGILLRKTNMATLGHKSSDENNRFGSK